MGMVKFLVGLAAFLGVCMLSFNYVQGHRYTLLEQERNEWKSEAGRISGEFGSLKTDKINVEGKLKQACSLLKAAEVENSVCGEPESSEELVRLMEDGDSENGENSDG